MSIHLSDTQLVMLSAAAQRDSRYLVPPQNLKGGAAQKVGAKLIAAGLVKQVKAKAGAPVWRRDEEAGQSYALKLTAVGAKAIAIDESLSSGKASKGGERGQAAPTDAAIEQQAPADVPPDETVTSLSAPRSGTKLAQVIELLQRDIGATLEDLIATTGWLPHTTRAALTGLRKRGFAVAIDRSDKERGSTYRIRTDRILAGQSEAAGEGSKEAERFGASRARRSA
jgi:hypothetical protein